MKIFLLVIKDSTCKPTKKQMKVSKVGREVQSSEGLTITSYCRFKLKYLMRLLIFDLINDVEVDFTNRSRVQEFFNFFYLP